MTGRSEQPLHAIEASQLQARRERVFLVLAGLFLGSMTMLNILGISRFIKLYELPYQLANGETWNITFAVAVGVLPYPVTFLCTDFICEFYGRRRANWVVSVGVLLNVWVIFILWLGGVLPGAFEDPELAAQGEDGIFSDSRPVVRGGRRLDGGLSGGTVLRCLLVSLLEEIDQR